MGRAVSATVIPMRRASTSRTSETSDEALLAACTVSDASALGVLFDRHHLRVHRFIARVAGTRGGDTEDMLQDTFTAVWSSAHKFKGSSTGLTWIFGIAANIARNYARSRARGAKAMLSLTEVPAAGSERGDDIAARNEALRRVETGMVDLTYDQRVAFVMCDLEGVSGVDAAKTLGIPAGTMWRRLHDARTRLRASIQGGEP